jgi:hypothetical protein
MIDKNTAVNSANSIDAITKGLQPATGCPRLVPDKCRKPTSRLYQESLDLEDDLRYSLPSYAMRYFDKALAGDVDAAEFLLVSAPNSRRGDIALLFYLRGASAELQRTVLGAAWSHDHLEVLSASERPSRLERMFRATKCPLPDFIPDPVQLWRGSDRYGWWGISWTLRRDVAVWFARQIKRRKGKPMVFSTIVSRNDILFYDDSREEAECVIFGRGEISHFELDSFDEKEGVRQSTPSMVEDSSVHVLGSYALPVSDSLAV